MINCQNPIISMINVRESWKRKKRKKKKDSASRLRRSPKRMRIRLRRLNSPDECREVERHRSSFTRLHQLLLRMRLNWFRKFTGLFPWCYRRQSTSAKLPFINRRKLGAVNTPHAINLYVCRSNDVSRTNHWNEAQFTAETDCSAVKINISQTRSVLVVCHHINFIKLTQ